MRSLSHRTCDPFSRGLNGSNRYSLERPLVLNCTGTYVTHSEFNTYNSIGRDDYYLLYVVSGKLNVTLADGSIRRSEKGDLWIFPPHLLYRYSHTESEELEYMYVHFTGSEVERVLVDCGLKKHPEVNCLRDDGGVYLRFREIFDAFAHQDGLRDRELSALLERLLITLGRSLRGREDNALLKKSIAYINSSYDTQLSVPELARLESLSPSRYSTLFKKIMGVPPMEYVTSLRMAAACSLLSSTDIPVCDIGASVGYSDPHFFSRIFKKCTGLSPLAFRKRERS